MGQLLNIEAFSKTQNPIAPSAPVLRMSKKQLRAQAELFIEQFPGETSYAVKANAEEGVIETLVQAGITSFDVASPFEMNLVKGVLPTAKLHYHNPIRSKEEVALALYIYDCKRFSVDHIDALQEIYEQANNPKEIEIAIRFRMETKSKAVQSFKSKFGVLRDEATYLAHEAQKMGFTVGLTFHPGSQTVSPAPYLEHMAEAHDINNQLSKEIEFLNVGGGFPSRYEGIDTAPLTTFFDAIRKAYNSSFNTSKVTLECEPGRALVASAGTLITKVKAARRDRHELFLNDGIYGGLMEFHQFPDLFPAYSTPKGAYVEADTNWTVYGPTCDPIDVLPNTLALPSNLQEGDIVEFHGVGAYSTATSTRFNGYGAIEVQMV